MADPGRLVVISNRLPVSLVRQGTEWQIERSAGGLATAMDPILKRSGGIWIGWSGALESEPPEARELLQHEQGCISVDLPADIAEKFYQGYSNRCLWPLFHSFASKLEFDSEAWEAYIEANRRFCSAVLDQYRAGDQIWIHDYHLMLLPDMLREKLPDSAIGFFLHIPFPSSDLFSTLPRGEDLLTGLLGADLVSFQTHLHLQHFRGSLRRLAGLESNVDRLETSGREVALEALPIGIDPDEFLRFTQNPETQEQLHKFREEYEGRKVIAAIDRLDYTKGLPERLRTFRRLLANSPELTGKVTLMQVAVPSRENIESYQELRAEVHQLVSEINGKFSTPDWTPVVYIHRSISRSELVAIYQLADVAWISSLRDGMNLVAKEYVACKPGGDGVLVLSTFAGAAAEMGEALLINPFDEERTAETVMRALSMSPEEKRDRMGALHERVLRNNVFAWGERFLGVLHAVVSRRGEQARQRLPLLPADTLDTAYRQAHKRLLLLDYDGTLVRFTALPHEAIADRELLALLSRLTEDPANGVVIISGRSMADVDRWFGSIPRLGLAAEHGARWRLPDSTVWQGRSSAADWKGTVRPILEHFVDRTPGSLVEEKEFALVWHYRMVEPEFGEWLAAELVAMLEEMLAETELRAYRGNKIVEVKPIWVNKGALATQLLDEYADADFVFGIGDDRTDEDLFAQLPANAWSVHVGSGPSKASYRIPNVRSVRELLDRLAT
jgi:trehalose 6-phosphate synthase/phosphatase